jgi:hypothetical protein
MGRLTIILCLLTVLAVFAAEPATVTGALAANASNDFTAKLGAGDYSVIMVAPGSAWSADILYTCYG